MIANQTILLTGATGFLGSHLLKILLDNGNKVYVLARSKDNLSANERVIEALKFWEDGSFLDKLLHRVKVIEADVTQANLGIKSLSDIQELISQTQTIFHSAALTAVKIPLKTVRIENVEGTRNILEFALECKKKGSLRKVNYISTAYVLGDKKDVDFSEDMLELGQNFYNNYEQSKYEAELVAREYLTKGLNVSVFRPSMVMGDTIEGKTNNFGVFYGALHFFSQGIFDEFPANQECRQNIVNIDTVTKAISLLGDRQEPAVYHITSPGGMSIEFFMKAASGYFGFKTKLVPLESFNFAQWTPAQKTLAEPYIPYFNYGVSFLCHKTQKILEEEYKFEYPNIDAKNLGKIFTYCQKTRFIKSSQR